MSVGLASVLAAGTALVGLGAGTAAAAETTYTHPDGATVGYDTEARVGEPIHVSGTGWLAKPDMVEEGEEGSVIGFKLIDPTLSQLNRSFELENPRLGTPVTNTTVWGAVQADSDGSFEINLPWPDASNAVADPQWEAGDTFTLQLLSGTMYSDEPGVDPSQRPDVSRTIPLTITVAGESTDPEPEPEPEPTKAAPTITQQPEAAATASGAQVSFTAKADGEPAPTVVWQRSTSLNATTPPANFTNLTAANTVDDSFAKQTLVVVAGQNSNTANRWYRAVFTNSEGSVTSQPVKLSIAPAPTVTTQPLGQTVETGGTATFSAAATSSIDLTMQWQSTRTTLPNGEPDDSTWANVAGATDDSLTVQGTDADALDGTFYRLVFSNASGATPTRAAQLRFFSKLDTRAPVTVTGTTYGPAGATPREFSVRAPNAVVKGEDIVIEGFNYLAIDGKAGSVANALVDAEYSGDPRTLNTRRTVYNPQTGAVYSDKRGHNVVQAGGSDGNQGGQTIVTEDGAQVVHYPEWDPGYFRVIIPWPDETNTTQTAAFFAENWKAGTQHTVRFLTGTLFSPNGGDYQSGISVRFTVVDEATAPAEVAPEVTTQPAAVSVEAGEDAIFTAAASGTPQPTVHWQSSADGTDWAVVEDATSTTLTLPAVTTGQSGTQYRAVFTNAAGTATSNAATLTVTEPEPQDPALLYTEVLSAGQPAGTLITPREVAIGESITIAGKGWLVADGSEGSGGPVFVNQPSGGTGPVTVVGRTVENQIPGSTYSDVRAHGVWKGDANGDWSITIPFPTPANSSLTAETAWQVGQEQTLRILTGSLVSGDRIRTVSVPFTIVAADQEPPAEGLSYDVSRPYFYGDTIHVTSTGHSDGDEAYPFLIPVGADPYESDGYANGSAPADADGVAELDIVLTGINTGSATPVVPGAYQFAEFTADDEVRLGPVLQLGPNPAVAPPVLATEFPQYTEVSSRDTVTLSNQAEGALGTNWVRYHPRVGSSFAADVDSFPVHFDGLPVDGTTLTFGAWNAGGAVSTTTEFRLVTSSTAPAVTAQPSDVSVDAGQNATFTAAASGEPTPAVQWQSSTDGATWADVAGATGTTLTVAATTAAQNGTQYRAVFTNAAGSATSDAATLTVTQPSDVIETPAPAGGVLITPRNVVIGQPITISGKDFFLTNGDGGSGGPIFINQPSGGTGPVNVKDRAIENQIPDSTYTDPRAHGVFHSDGEGNWTITIPFPTPENSTLTAETAWQVGQKQSLRILTGSLVSGDRVRSVAAEFTIVAEDQEPEAAIALTNSTVEQFGDVWFNLTGFAPGTEVSIQLVNGAGEAVVSKPFTIGEDGNTANPDGQTYRKLTVPRDAVPGDDYAVRVVKAADDEVLATSDKVTVTAATTRVFNPGDHAGGLEDLLVQRGGVWTFHAVGFAPDGKLTATAEIGGETVTLGGLGQLSASEKAWQLDGNGDTLREPVFTRVQIPSEVEPGDLPVTFSDGSRTVTRTVTVEVPASASVTVDSSAVLGGTVRVTGTGFLHPNGTEGSTVAIKIDDGAFSRVDDSTHVNRTIWAIVEADEFGSFSIDMPVPNGTTADADGTLGSVPAMEPGQHSLRFLTGSLKPGDQSRSLKSDSFTVTADEPELEAATPTIAGSAVVGGRLTAAPGTWGPAPVEFAYQWLADGTPIAGATGPGYTVAVADIGRQLSVRVTGSKDGYPSQTRESSRTARVVAASAPVARVNPSIAGTPVVGKTLTAKPGSWSVAGLTFRYQWLRNGVAIPGATRTTYKVASADAGKNLQVRVAASKQGLLDGTATSAAVKAGKALTKTPTPTISGTAKVGKTLKAKAGSWKPSKVTVKYQWLRDGAPIAKATKSSYKLTKADAGRKISVRVTGSKSGYVSVAKTSKAKSVAKVKATVKLSVPSKVAKGQQATAKLTVTGAVSNPTGRVTLTVNGKKVTGVLTAAGKGKLTLKLPAIGKKGSYQVKASFSPTGETAVSTSKSSTVTKKLKVG